jgi:iron complex outermembrane recepter protein
MGVRLDLLAVFAAAIVLPTSAFPQSAAPGSYTVLEPIVVDGAAAGSEGAAASTSPVARPQASAGAEAGRKIEGLPGGAAILTQDNLKGKASVTVADALTNVPGVVVQSFFGGNDQPRIQIRGSGLQQNPVERGILVLQDGLPINRADGSYIVGFADPSSADFIEVYRGYTANRLGATVLGGAINFASPTGISAPGGTFGIEAGSFGQVTTHASLGAREGNLDAHASISLSQRDGFRDHNESERVNVNVNSGAKVNENISTRLFFGYTDLEFDVPGPLSKPLLEADPTRVCSGPPNCLGPNVTRDRPHREASQFRAGSRTAAQYGAHLLDLGLGYSYTEDSFRFPISGGVRDTEGGDLTSVLRYAYAPDAAQPLPLFEATALYVTGSAERDYFINDRGEKGAKFGEGELDASTLSLHAGLNLPLGHGFMLTPGISWAYAARDNADSYDGATRPTLAFTPGGPVSGSVAAQDTGYERAFSGWSPSLGLLYDLSPISKLFAAVSRSFEPPSHDDLIATIGGTPNRSPTGFATPDLEAQTATTLEAGWRGRDKDFAWDAVVYYSWVENELLNLRDASGVSLGAINADNTTHFGVELGIGRQLTGEIGVRLVYTYQDFRFDDDANHGDNRLAGAPEHIVKAAVRYTFAPGLFFEAEADWVPGKTPVDNGNTLFNDAYVVVDLRANYDINPNLSLYGEVRNVFDETYASSTLIVDTAQTGQAAFLPGDGRAFIAGLKGRF